MKFEVGDKFKNKLNNCEGYLIKIDGLNYTFQYDILDFFTESDIPACIKIDTINSAQLKSLIKSEIIEKCL